MNIVKVVKVAGPNTWVWKYIALITKKMVTELQSLKKKESVAKTYP